MRQLYLLAQCAVFSALAFFCDDTEELGSPVVGGHNSIPFQMSFPMDSLSIRQQRCALVSPNKAIGFIDLIYARSYWSAKYACQCSILSTSNATQYLLPPCPSALRDVIFETCSPSWTLRTAKKPSLERKRGATAHQRRKLARIPRCLSTGRHGYRERNVNNAVTLLNCQVRFNNRSH